MSETIWFYDTNGDKVVAPISPNETVHVLFERNVKSISAPTVILAPATQNSTPIASPKATPIPIGAGIVTLVELPVHFNLASGNPSIISSASPSATAIAATTFTSITTTTVAVATATITTSPSGIFTGRDIAGAAVGCLIGGALIAGLVVWLFVNSRHKKQ